jgi:hypothetical protein
MRSALVVSILVGALWGCSGEGSSTGQDGGADDSTATDTGGADAAPDQGGDTPAPDMARDTPPADEGGVDTAPADVVPDVSQPDSPPPPDMGQPDNPPTDTPPADMAPDTSLPPNSYTCRTLATGHPSVRAVNGEALRVDCDNASLDEAVCDLTETGQRYCFLCVRCSMPTESFCSAQPTPRVLTYDLACTGTGDEFCLYEERPVPTDSCS